MAVNVNEAYNKIRKVGATNVRTMPMAGQNIASGLYLIEVNNGSGWEVIVEGLPRQTAESLIASAVNRVLLG